MTSAKGQLRIGPPGHWTVARDGDPDCLALYKQSAAELDLAKHRLETASKDVRFRMAVLRTSDRS